MPVVRHGIDLVECARIAKLIDAHGQRFLHRILTSAERRRAEQFRNATAFVAGRFAAKEAILKMIGTGWRGKITWKDMEILPNQLGEPQVVLTGETARLASERGIKRILLSITHTATFAAASAIGIDTPGES